MNTPLDQDIRNRLLARRGEWPAIAASSGVSHSWISKFVRGQIPNPGYTTLTRLGANLGVRGLRRAAVVADTAESSSDEARAA
jgi:transcriptional regulator with XRE-family HTH domain